MVIETDVIRYGDDDDQFFKLQRISTLSNSVVRPVVVLIHGGFWKQKYNLSNALLDGVAPSLLENDVSVVLLEYRRGRAELDGGRGGWPETNRDIILALEKLQYLATTDDKYKGSLNLSKVVLVGHSAGGTLALWPCCAGSGEAIASLSFTPTLCIAIAPVGDLVQGYERKLSDNHTAVLDYVGCEPVYVGEVLQPVTSLTATLIADSPYR
jgi:acetyl esterase/lipase